MDTLTAQIQDDSDFDVEPELPSLKQVLGEETVRKLKPKEKKRQDVINGTVFCYKSLKSRVFSTDTIVDWFMLWTGSHWSLESLTQGRESLTGAE